MRVTEIAIAIALGSWGLLGGAGYALAGLAPPEFRKSKLAFWTAWISLWGIGPMWNLTATQSPLTRYFVIALIGAVAAVGLAFSTRWVTKREFLSQPKPSTVPVGAIAFVNMVPELKIHVSTGQVDVRLNAEVENTTDQLVHFDIVSMRGEVNGKSIPDPAHSVLHGGGYVYPHRRAFIRYPLIEHVPLERQAITGFFQYLISYSTVPATVIRRSGRRLDFEKAIPMAPQPVGTVQQYPIIVNSSEEFEE